MKSARGARFTRSGGRGESHLRRLIAKFAQNSLFAISAGPSANRPISSGNHVLWKNLSLPKTSFGGDGSVGL